MGDFVSEKEGNFIAKNVASTWFNQWKNEGYEQVGYLTICPYISGYKNI